MSFKSKPKSWTKPFSNGPTPTKNTADPLKKAKQKRNETQKSSPSSNKKLITNLHEDKSSYLNHMKLKTRGWWGDSCPPGAQRVLITCYYNWHLDLRVCLNPLNTRVIDDYENMLDEENPRWLRSMTKQYTISEDQFNNSSFWDS